MHEASLAGGVLSVVEQAAAREGFRRVRVLRLAVGALAGVEVPALRFALEAIAPGTCLQDAEVLIDEPPGEGWCQRCARSVPIARRDEACPSCGEAGLRPTAGLELRVVDLQVEDD